MSRIYQKQTYEDLAAIILAAKKTVAYSSVPVTASDILADIEAEVVRLFENKGQSFNKTRFLNAVKIEEPETDDDERHLALVGLRGIAQEPIFSIERVKSWGQHKSESSVANLLNTGQWFGAVQRAKQVNAEASQELTA